MRTLLASALFLVVFGAAALAADGGVGPPGELRVAWCPPGSSNEERSLTLPEGQFREVLCTAQGQRVRSVVLNPQAHLMRLGELEDGGVWKEHWLFANGQPWSVRTTLLPDRGAREDTYWPSGCRLGFTTVATRLDDPGVNVHTFFEDATPCLQRLDGGVPLILLEPAVSQADHLETATRVHHLRGGSISLGAADAGLGQACIGGTTVCHTWATRIDEWRLEWSSGARWALVEPTSAAADGGRDLHAVVFDVQRRSTRRLDGELIGPSRLRLHDGGGVLDLGLGTRENEPCEPGTELRQLGGGFVCLGPQSGDVLALMQVRGEQKLNCAVRVKTIIDIPYAKAWAVKELLTPGEPCVSLLRQLTVYAPRPVSWEPR